jgi:hypothetical protein
LNINGIASNDVFQGTSFANNTNKVFNQYGKILLFVLSATNVAKVRLCDPKLRRFRQQLVKVFVT